MQNRRANSSSIVADSQVEGSLAIIDFDLDNVRTRVPERVAKCLAGDHQSLLTHYGMQISGSALNAHLELDRVQLRQLFALRRERLREICRLRRRRAQILHFIPTLFEQLVGSIERLLHQLACRLLRRNAIRG